MSTVVFIGTFDPFHGAHVGQLLRAYRCAPFNKALILVDKNPSHKPHATSWQHRLQMAKLTLGALDLPFEYAVTAVNNSLADEIAEHVDFKVTGIDSLIENLLDSSRWELATKWPMIVLSIPGIEKDEMTRVIDSLPSNIQNSLNLKYFDETDSPLLNYNFEKQASSAVRVHATALRSGTSKAFLPVVVHDYIALHKLYHS